MTWEERWHPLREEWVVISAHRDKRPWKGETVRRGAPRSPSFDATCTFCPGNVRVSGAANPRYENVFVFDNDAPCVGPEAPEPRLSQQPVFRSRRADGLARVVCFSPRHDLSLAEMSSDDIDRLLGVWQDQYRELGARPEVEHVLAFENKGAVVGVSNPHPHGQIYATNFVFRTIEVEVRAAKAHWQATRRSLLGDVIAAEEADGSRVIASVDSALAFVPYFARYPYETYVAPRAAHASIAALSARERRDFAATLRSTLARLDNLWEMSFPYVLVLHQAPTDGREHEGFHFHVQIHPPLRRPDLLKYLAGPEAGGGCFLNDTAPESKAAELRALSDVHHAARLRPGAGT